MKLACITGASSGIGKEFAKRLSLQDYELILVARNQKALEELASSLGTNCTCLSYDLSDEEKAKELGDLLCEKEIDLLINNAGFGLLEDFDSGDLERDLDMIDVNVKALHVLFQKVLSMMVKRDSGSILNVASSAGLLDGGPYMATYYATKAYVTSLTSAVYQELKEKGSHVYVGMLCPGPVDTNFNDVAQVQFALKGISVEDCVDYALQEMKKGTLTIVPGNMIRLGVKFARIVPRKMQLKIAMRQQQKKR